MPSVLEQRAHGDVERASNRHQRRRARVVARPFDARDRFTVQTGTVGNVGETQALLEPKTLDGIHGFAVNIYVSIKSIVGGYDPLAL